MRRGARRAARGRFVIMGDADDSYDFSQLDGFLTGTLGQFFEWVPVCPEVGIGLLGVALALYLVLA